MTCNSIYMSALALIGEPEHSAATKDYGARAPRLLTTIFCELARYEHRFYGTVRSGDELMCESLDDEFVLNPALAAVTIYYLASMLISDAYESLSVSLFKKGYAILELLGRDCTTVSSTVEVYE